jgi:hypothetical protein
VHDSLADFLPSDRYFRFNPVIENMSIDEIRPEKLAYLKVEEGKPQHGCLVCRGVVDGMHPPCTRGEACMSCGLSPTTYVDRNRVMLWGCAAL